MSFLHRLILNLPFVQAALKEAERQGGIASFPLAQKDILETMRDDLDKQANELARTKLNALLSVVDEKLVVTFDTRSAAIYIGGEKADMGRLANLKAEAEFLTESDLWKILNQTIRRLAERAMFVDGDNLDTMRKGRTMLYLLDTQDKIIGTFKAFIHK